MFCVLNVLKRIPTREPIVCLMQIHEYANRMEIAFEFIGNDNRNRCYRIYLLRICSGKRNNDGDRITFNKQTTIKSSFPGSAMQILNIRMPWMDKAETNQTYAQWAMSNDLVHRVIRFSRFGQNKIEMIEKQIFIQCDSMWSIICMEPHVHN